MTLPTSAISTESTWQSLYKMGGVAALLMVTITLMQVVVFAVAPPPLEGTALAWFALFQQSALQGLLAFESLLILYVLLSIPVTLALGAALRHSSPSLTALYVALSVVGVAAFIVARPVLEMWYLSNQYAAAGSAAERAAFLAAGEGMVALFHGTTFQTSYLLGSMTGLLIAGVMLQSGIFSRTTASLRIASSVLDLGIYLPGIGLYLSLLSVLFLLLFHILLARRLLKLGSGALSPAPSSRPLTVHPEAR